MSNMTSDTLSLARVEMKRVWRNRRYLIFTIALPVVLFLLVARTVPARAQAYGVPYRAYYMLAMASFGAFGAALQGNAQRISQERKDGWIRQLRLTPLPAGSYVIAKIIAAMVTTVPSIVIVLLLGRFYGGIHLTAWKWPVIALAIWIGAMSFAALAVALGYRFVPDTVQPVTMVVYFAMSILGGLWFAVSGWLAAIGKVLPTYQIVHLGAQVMAAGTVPVVSVVTVLAWLAAFVTLAALSVRSTVEKV
jgi:ABC-2 type transport system permease protein